MKRQVSETSKQVVFVVLLVLAGAAIGWFLIPGPQQGSSDRGGKAGDGAASAAGGGVVTELTQTTFDQHVLISTIPVMVDFYADWCGPCQQIAPVIDELARETTSAKFVRVNVDQNAGLAERYGVTLIPRLLVFKDGQIIADATGAVSKGKLKSMLGI